MIVVLSRRVRHGDHLPVQHAEREVPRLTVSLSGVFCRRGVPGEDGSSVREVDPVLLEVLLALRLVLGERATIVATRCSYGSRRFAVRARLRRHKARERGAAAADRPPIPPAVAPRPQRDPVTWNRATA